MATQMVARRMKRELQLLAAGSAAPGITAWPRDEASLTVLDAEICGAADTPYERGLFRLEVHIPPEYPLKPPRVRFVTPIYHPNIDSQGRICLDTLTMPPKGAWKPSLNVATLLTTVQALMSSPNPDDGLMVDITHEYRRNPALFQKKARAFTDKHASPANSADQPLASHQSHASSSARQASSHQHASTSAASLLSNLDHQEDRITPAPANTLHSTNEDHAEEDKHKQIQSPERSPEYTPPPTSGRLKKKPRLS